MTRIPGPVYAALAAALVIDVPSMIWGGMPLWAAISVLLSMLSGAVLGLLATRD